MQDNEPLMMELSKLIRINEPDLTLFVGEAVVGNEGVDQVNKFNRSLLDHGCQPNPGTKSVIDGIVLTKFDAVVKDGLVGAAVSMTYETGQPIVFVGVGQKYNDLRQLSVKAVVDLLMK
jgi:signal recognition particle receptor subunit alpha